MKIYMGFDGELGSGEGACLVFANNAKEAKKLAYPVVNSWFSNGYMATRVLRLRSLDYLFKLSRSAQPHVINFPGTCPVCESWGTGEIIDGSCRTCTQMGLDVEYNDA